jgi:hypothetical protein
VRDQVEIELIFTLDLNHSCINDGSWARVQAILILFNKQTVLNVAIHQAVNNLRLVARS